jgi:hypothetical protein
LVANFFEALLSDDPKRKKLAIKAVLIALKDEGPELVKIVEESEDASEIKSFAKTTLDAKRIDLLEQLFSETKAYRIQAYNDFVSGWKNDSKMAWEIVKYGKSHINNQDGVYNALVTLSHMNTAALSSYKEDILEFSKQAEANGEKTKERSNKLRSRL